MKRTTIRLTIWFKKGYIAHPYWPEREEVINIGKESGMNRVRSEARRASALAAHLQRLGLSPEDYAALEARADRAWYRVALDDESSEIVVPAHQYYGCLIEACKSVTAALRPCEPDNFRHIVEMDDFRTGKTTEDGIFTRLVMPKSGTGQPLSNQRALRSNPYIADVRAAGTLAFYADDLRDKGEFFADFLGYAGHRVGVGAARKMGYGRYEVVEYVVVD